MFSRKPWFSAIYFAQKLYKCNNYHYFYESNDVTVHTFLIFLFQLQPFQVMYLKTITVITIVSKDIPPKCLTAMCNVDNIKKLQPEVQITVDSVGLPKV